ncbi:bola-domain-containing protein [Microstroma glucosiphilum]|uniref:Bola-domain-containing protein n=1 Tax=Pseudomicrostroma glucosiphilum TaxID=1684307 RepID=A0A316UA10_9BASI|nr:bola-domain-containing protein [Pseudomicrostroma glucosiphilum]PWN21654.1 bola-domain-containing protein [Pseudomicrostroma glucosiphilum]
MASFSSSLRRLLNPSTASSLPLRLRSFTSTARIMSIEESMRNKIQSAFKPTHLKIRNDSSKHAHHAAMAAQGGGNGETHFYIEVVSDDFSGKTQIARHRSINSLLSDEFASGLHALSLRTKTPAEVEKESAAR